MSLRFHWSLSQVGDKFRRAKPTADLTGLLSFEAQLEFCRRAEESGIESLLMAFGFTRPDPLALAVALGMMTEKIKFMVACRSGIFSPTFFVQQVNTVSALINGRICINMVTGHSPHELRYYGDFQSHDERYKRTEEFLAVCNAFWSGESEINYEGNYYRIEKGRLNTPFVSPDLTSPEIFIGGNSDAAAQLTLKYGSCLWRFADTPQRLGPQVMPLVAQGIEVGLLVSLLARPSREQALHDAYSMIAQLSAQPIKAGKEFAQRTDSVAFRSTLALAEESDSDWLTPYLWTGAIPYLGAPAIALVGTPEEIVTAIMEYKKVGISQFLFMGWPDIDEMSYFGQEILPLIRRKEAQQ